MRAERATTVLVFTLLIAGQPAAGDSLTISDWSLGVIVHDSSTGQVDGGSFATVQNPFRDSHSAAVGVSTAESSYDFAWIGPAGTFLIEGTHEAEDVDSATLVAASSGFIWVQPSVDLTLTLSGLYSYSLPPGMMLVQLVTAVFDEELQELVFYDLQQDDSFNGLPAAGSLVMDGELNLAEGHSYSLSYEMRIQSFAGQTGQLGTGTGFVDFQITPEPSTLGLLVFGALGLLTRRRAR